MVLFWNPLCSGNLILLFISIYDRHQSKRQLFWATKSVKGHATQLPLWWKAEQTDDNHKL
jgi:hypothetical protein